MTYERFCYLLELYKSSRLSAEGMTEFMKALDSDDFDADLHEDILSQLRGLPRDEKGRLLRHPLWTQEAEQTVWEEMVEAAPFRSPATQVPETPVRRLPAVRWWRVASVAAVFMAVATGYYFFFLSSGPPQKPLAAKSLPIPGNKAILTLGDGTRIVLDSAGNGTLAQQGGVQVVKLANGQLAYRQPGQQADGSSGQQSDHPSAQPATVLYNTMETPRGGQYQLLLPDGSKVWLNSASSIRYPNLFTGADRRVQVTGEAYFEVAKNTALPFIVEARDMQVRVLGTEFDLMAYTDEEVVKTTLVTGGVKVIDGPAGKVLLPGQQASLPDHSSDFVLSEADLKETLAWKEGKFRFTRSSIKPMMRQIARWYDVDIVYKGELPDVGFTGVISRKEKVTELLEVLEDAGKVHFTLQGNTIVVSAVKQPL